MKNIFASILLVSLLASCSTVKVKSWADPQFAGRKAGKTMVLGIAESDSVSRQYEALFVERLTELGVEADSLHALVQKTDPVSEEDLVAALQEQGYDSIIVTRKLSETERTELVTTGYRPDYADDYYGYYSFGYALTYDTAYVQNYMEFMLEINLYDVKTKKLVWTGRTVVYDNHSDFTNMKGIIKGVVKDLGRKGLL